MLYQAEQVAEFIAPIDYVMAAPIVNWLGRRYRGREDEFCECIVETGPTSGEALQERLINEYGYWNLYRKLNMSTYTQSTSFGWAPTQQSVFDLWFRTKPHISYSKTVELKDGSRIERVKFVARSRYLVEEEMRNCEQDPKRQVAKAEFGFHDDAVRAIQLAVYAAHGWQSYGDVADAVMDAIPDEHKPDYQATDMTREEMMDDVDRKLEPEAGDVY